MQTWLKPTFQDVSKLQVSRSSTWVSMFRRRGLRALTCISYCGMSRSMREQEGKIKKDKGDHEMRVVVATKPARSYTILKQKSRCGSDVGSSNSQSARLKVQSYKSYKSYRASYGLTLFASLRTCWHSCEQAQACTVDMRAYVNQIQ